MDASSPRSPSCHSEAGFSPELNKHVCRDYSCRSNSFEVASVCNAENGNEPSENNYGPGRTLRKALNSSGHRIDIFLSKAAEHLGYGPLVIARRMRARSSLIEHSLFHYESRSCRHCRAHPSWYTYCEHYCRGCDGNFLQSQDSISGEMDDLRKDCKRLLKYVKSNVHSTKKQALDRILDLSVDHHDVRSLLQGLGAVEIIENACRVYTQFRLSDEDDLLLSSSQKALVSLRDTKLNKLLHEWSICSVRVRDLNRGPRWEKQQHMFMLLWNRISPYLRDSDVAFLVVRVLRSTVSRCPGVWCFREQFWPSFHDRVLPSIASSLDYFEWEEFTALLMEGDWYNPGQCVRCSSSRKFSGNIPQLLGMCETKTTTNGGDMFALHERCHCVRIIGHAMAPCRGKNAMSFDALKSLYPSPRLEPLLQRLACSVDALMSDPIFDDAFDWSVEVATEEECAGYKSLVKFIDSDDPALQQKAWQYIDFVLRHDIYRCERVLQALSSTAYATTIDFNKFKETKRKECAPEKSEYSESIYRCLDENGVHVYDDYLRSKTRNFEEKLSLRNDWILSYPVKSNDTIITTCLHPIVAGQTKDGKCIYVARTVLYASCDCCGFSVSFRLIFAIEEGTKLNDICAEVICEHQRTVKRLKFFYVYVLRYALEAYPASYDDNDVGLDATGPFSWRPVRGDEERWDRKRFSVRVIPTKDAFPDENASVAAGCGPEDAESIESGSAGCDDSGSSSCCEFVNDDSDLDTGDKVDCDSSENEDAHISATYTFDGEFNSDADCPPLIESDSETDHSHEWGVAVSGVGNEKPAFDACGRPTHTNPPQDSTAGGLEELIGNQRIQDCPPHIGGEDKTDSEAGSLSRTTVDKAINEEHVLNSGCPFTHADSLQSSSTEDLQEGTGMEFEAVVDHSDYRRAMIIALYMFVGFILGRAYDSAQAYLASGSR